MGSPGGAVVKNPPASAGDVGLIPGSGRSRGEGNGNLEKQRSLVGYSPWGREELHTTEQSTAHPAGTHYVIHIGMY